MKHSILTAVLLIGLIVIVAVGTELIGIRLYDRVVTNLLISMVLVVGLQTFMGNSGLLSFAHIGLMGFGAYTSAVLTIPAQMKGMALPDLYAFMKVVEVSPFVAMIAAGLVAALVAAVVAYPLMRLSDAAAVITSFAPKAFYLKETFLIITMLVIGGAGTVTGAVIGTLLVTFAYEGLRATEGALNATSFGAGQVVGLTEIVLALAMIAVMILKPGGLFPTREIGHLILRATRKKETTS